MAAGCTNALDLGGEELPGSWHTLQVALTTTRELDRRAGHEWRYDARHQDLVGSGGTHHPSGDVDRDPTDVGTSRFDLTDVHSRPDLDTDPREEVPKGCGAPKRASRSGEGGQQP